MAITYTWTDPDNTELRFEDDSTSPTTELLIPAIAGNRFYAEYLAWVDEGNTATDYTYPGYEDLATAKTTRIADAKAAVTGEIRSGLAEKAYEYVRSLADSTYTLPVQTQTDFDAYYALLDNFITDVNAATVIENVRTATIDFQGNTYNVPS